MRHVRGRDLIDPALVATWAHGWAASRGKPPPTVDGAALRIEVDEPDQLRRYVFPRPPHGVAEIAARITDPLVFLKVPAAEGTVRALLPPAWSMAQTGSFMVLDMLPTAREPPPAGYTLSISDQSGVTLARVRTPSGQVAAQGRLVIVDGLAIHDRIRTEPAHGRRGLGRAVMAALGRAAREQGASSGALVATGAGLALYTPLGWRSIAPYVTAQRA